VETHRGEHAVNIPGTTASSSRNDGPAKWLVVARPGAFPSLVGDVQPVAAFVSHPYRFQ